MQLHPMNIILASFKDRAQESKVESKDPHKSTYTSVWHSDVWIFLSFDLLQFKLFKASASLHSNLDAKSLPGTVAERRDSASPVSASNIWNLSPPLIVQNWLTNG